MKTLQERLQHFIVSLDKSVLSFENQCGIAPGTVSKMSEKSRPKTIEKIARAYPQLNIEWLKSGEGEMLKEEAAKITIKEVSDSFNGSKVLNKFLEMLEEKDRVIDKKDRVIEEKDKRIQQLTDRLLDIKE